MTAFDVQAATSTFDCRVAGCPGEARVAGGRCDHHERIAPVPLGPPTICKVCGGELDEIGRTTSSNLHRHRCKSCRSALQRKRARAAGPDASSGADGPVVAAALELEAAAERFVRAQKDLAAARARLARAVRDVSVTREGKV